MEPILLVHGYSAESADDSLEAVRSIYGDLPDFLQTLGAPVVPVNLSRYLSLVDGVGVDDISLALERWLQDDRRRNGDQALLKTGFNAIIHSTGALVVRNWVRRFSPTPSPLKRLIHLAGANLGSGWAHVGQSLLAKWGRIVFQNGTERGMAVLSALELGADWTLDLHCHFLRNGTRMREDYRTLEFCIIGSQVPPPFTIPPVRYGKEDGSDGVVRVSAGNLNFHYLAIGPAEDPTTLDWEVLRRALETSRSAEADDFLRPERTLAAFSGYRLLQDSRVVGPDADPGRIGELRPRIPFAIPYQCAHSTDEWGVVYGTRPQAQVRRLIEQALNATEATYDGLADAFEGETDATYTQAAATEHGNLVIDLFRRASNALRLNFDNPHGQYDPHAQLIVRVRDQRGRPVPAVSVFFNSHGGDSAPAELIDALIEDHHGNGITSGIHTYYLRLGRFQKDRWVDRVAGIGGINLEIDADDPQGDGKIAYLPLRLSINGAQLSQWLRPHRTTILDVTLLRVPAPDVFSVHRA